MQRRVGIDLALSGVHTAIVAAGAALIGKAFRFDTTREGLDELVKRAAGDEGESVEFVLEPTGNVWPIISACLQAKGHRVLLVKTQQSSDLRKFFSRHCKTDGIDAGTIARVPEVDPNGAHALVERRPAVFHLQREVKQRYRFVQTATAHKLRIQAAMQLGNPHLLGALGSDKFCGAGRILMREMLDAPAVVSGGREQFEARLRKACRGRIAGERVEKLWQAYVATAKLLD